MSSVLKDWLGSDQDYEIGLHLLRQIEGESYNVTFLESHEKLSFSKKRMADLLRQHCDAGGVVSPFVTPKTTPKSPKGDLTSGPVKFFKGLGENIPAAVMPIVERFKQLYKENAARKAELNGMFAGAMARMHNDLVKVGDYMIENGSAHTVHVILDTDDELDRLRMQKEHYDLHGTFAVDEVTPLPDLPDDKFELQRVIQRTRELISKNKNNPKRAADVAAAKKLREEAERKLGELV